MSEHKPTAAATLPTADDADEVYNALMVAAAIVDERVGVVSAIAGSCDGSELEFVVDLNGIGAVAAIAADIRLRAEDLRAVAEELDAAVFNLDNIRRLQRDARAETA